MEVNVILTAYAIYAHHLNKFKAKAKTFLQEYHIFTHQFCLLKKWKTPASSYINCHNSLKAVILESVFIFLVQAATY